MSNQNQALEMIKQQVQKETDQTLNLVFDQLVENANDSSTALPENIFIQYFLPYFSGQLKTAERPQVIAEWIGIAGSPMAEVAIVNPNREVLYYVPGIFDTSFLTIRDAGNSSNFQKIANETNMLGAHLPARGKSFQINAMNEKTKELISSATPSNMKANEQRWLEIFNRYGIQLPKQDNQSQSMNVNQQSDLTSDEVYD